MLDISIVREQTKEVKDSIKKKHQYEKIDLVDEVIKIDEKWRKKKGLLDDLRHKRNSLSKEINKAKKAGETASDLLRQARQLPDKIKDAEKEEEKLRKKVEDILRTLPNILDDEVPKGEGEKNNVVRKESGKKPKFSFKPKSHVELCERLGIADFDASRKTSGHGFFFLKGDLALLDLALLQYALDIMIKEGFTPVIPPYMIRKSIVDGTVDFDFFKEIVYKLEDEDLYPISTSEHPLIGMYIDQSVESKDLPVKLCGYSPCFRKELGAHGIDEKGLFRTHQFHKIEQIVLCSPKDSKKWFDKLLGITQKIFDGLGIATRQLEMCSGDLGDLKSRQIDIEAWSPRRNDYFELGSCSNLTGAQARRLNIRSVKGGERAYVHTLNNTALATSRALVAILENFQTADGDVLVPRVLQKYMGGKKKLG